MQLNQITLGTTDFSLSVEFYERLGLRLIVSSRSEYARFECPIGGATLSLHLADHVSDDGPVVYFEVDHVDSEVARIKRLGLDVDELPRDQAWLWREARLRDPSGNRVCIYHAGRNRRFPPWRIDQVE